MTDEEYYWEIVQKRICAKCVDGDGAGGCRVASDLDCALGRYFPQVLESIRSASGGSIVPYEEQLRNKVCGICIHQSADNSCSLRKEVDCALDRYFPLLVQVLEEARMHKRVQ
jgi:hypothetical protein